MRTQEEIVARIEQRKDKDPLGFELPYYLSRLGYEHAKPYLKPETTKEEWDEVQEGFENIRQEMIDYMPFAWEKANNKRGISASRSIHHYIAWLWLEGEWPDDEIDALENYSYYGKDELRKICEYLGLDPDKFDDSIRENW